MYGVFLKTTIASLALSAVLTACADPPRRVSTASGREIQLPACKDYVSKFSDFSIRADILNKYQGELKLSAGNRATLETLQQDYGIQARQLCENAPLYINAGTEQQYFCREERLSNSLAQLRTLNSFLDRIHNVGDAKSQAENINKLADDFMKRFFTQFDKPCSEPPKPLSLQEIRSEFKDATRELLAELGVRPAPLAPNLPPKEVARELTELGKELTSFSERVEKEYAEGDRYYKEKNFDAAISHFKNAIDLVSKIPSLYLALGKSFSASHRYNDAVATYDRGLKVAKETEKVYVNLIASRGSAKVGLGHHQEAIDDLSLAIKLSSDDADHYYNRGLAKYHLNDFTGTLADFTNAIKLKPDDDDSYYSRGLAKQKLNDLPGALADYTAAIELGPAHADAYYNRGVTKYQLNDFPGALADSTEAIKRSPNYADAYYSRGLAKQKLNDLPGAITDYTAAIELNPNDADAYYNRSVAKSFVNDFPGALADSTATIKLNPNDADAYYHRGAVKSRLNDYQGVIADSTAAIKLNPNDARAYYSRGVAKILLNDLQSAITDFTESITLSPDHADAYYNRGVAKSRLNDFLGAIADYTAAINLGPNLDDAYEARGSAHTALRNEKEATGDFRRAMELHLKLSQASAIH